MQTMRRIPLLLLLLACLALVGVLPARAGECEHRCLHDYDALVEECVGIADMTDPTGPGVTVEYSCSSSKCKETPIVDAGKLVRDECRKQIGTDELDSCRAACKSPASCEENCKANYPRGFGRSRCIDNCDRRLRRHSF